MNIRTIDINGEILYNAKDLCFLMNHSDTSQMFRKLKKDKDKFMIPLDTNGGNQKMLFITGVGAINTLSKMETNRSEIIKDIIILIKSNEVLEFNYGEHILKYKISGNNMLFNLHDCAKILESKTEYKEGKEGEKVYCSIRWSRVMKHLNEIGIENIKEDDYISTNDVKLWCAYSNTKRYKDFLIFILNIHSYNNENFEEYIDIKTSLINERMEIKFLNQLEDVLKPLSIEGQRQYNIDNKYRIDFYIPSLNLAIEYDEAQHNTLTNQIKDEERQSYIEDKLGCRFVRCDYRNTDAYNIGLVMKEIINR